MNKVRRSGPSTKSDIKVTLKNNGNLPQNLSSVLESLVRKGELVKTRGRRSDSFIYHLPEESIVDRRT